jgi:glycosyltransferase involved in cell wall biosynthesis
LHKIASQIGGVGSEEYYLYHYRDKPVVALPVVNDRLRRAGVCRYPIYSFKRRIFRRVLQAAIFFRIDRFWSRRGPLSEKFVGDLDFSRFVAHLCQGLQKSDLFPVIHRPPQENRARFYIHLLDQTGKPVAFVKVAQDEFNNGQLAREAKALARYHENAHAKFKVPALMGQGEFARHRYIILEPLPPGTSAAPLKWPALRSHFDQIANSTVVLDSREIRATEWWNRYEKVRDTLSDDFNNECDEFAAGELPVCRVHGDLGVNNLARAGGDLWVIDWEESSDIGPRRTDEVGYYISVHQKWIFRNPRAAARHFHRTFLRDATESDRSQIIAAMAFLVSTGRDAALEIVRVWRDVPAQQRRKSAIPTASIISNEPTPYRVHVLNRLADELTDAKIENIFTHTLSKPSMPWEMQISARLRPRFFPRRHLTLNRPLSWRSVGLFRSIRDQLVRSDAKLIVLLGYNDLTRLLLIRWAHRRKIPLLLAGDSNIFSDARLSAFVRPIKRTYLRWVLKSIAGLMPMGTCGRAFFRIYRDHDLPEFLFPYEPDYEALARTSPSLVRQFQGEHGLDPRRKRFLVCGRLADVKRVDVAIDAFERVAYSLPDWDLVIAGDGPLREDLETRVPPDLRSRVKFLGFLQFEQTAACYRACQVLVHTSEFEPWGLVINEAVACGLAVIATAVTGAAVELVSHRRNGLIISPGSVDALVDAMHEVVAGDAYVAMQAASPVTLHDWRKAADPVDGFRAALRYFGVMPDSSPAFDSRIPDVPTEDLQIAVPTAANVQSLSA